MRFVDCVPEDSAACGGGVEVVGGGVAGSDERPRCSYEKGKTDRVPCVERPFFTGSGRCARKAVRLLIT